MLKSEYLEEGLPSHSADSKHVQSIVDVDTLVRNGFLRKVFGILSVQLLATAALCAAFMYVDIMRMFMLANPSLPFASSLLSLVLIIACYANLNVHPTNIRLLFAWTGSIAFTVASTCARLQAGGLGSIVIVAVGITAAITVGLTLYALRTKKDFSFLGAGLASTVSVLFFLGLWSIFFPFSNTMQIVYAGVGAVTFSLYILFDVWNISHRLGPDEYVAACITLYLDIINLFLNLLRLLSAMSRRD